MLRYFYLFCLLLCNDWCFCYNYISDETADNTDGRLKKHPRFRMRSQDPKHKDQVQQHRDIIQFQQPPEDVAEGMDRSAEFNIANFIGQPEYNAIDADDGYHVNSGKKLTFDYYGLNELLEPSPGENIKKRSDTDYTSTDNTDNSENEKLNNSEGSQEKELNLDEVPTEKIMIHKPQKKHLLEFPFFSRDKTDAAKPKKGKKRKMFGRCIKKTNLRSTKSTEPGLAGMEAQSNFTTNKKAYRVRLCPLCKRRFANDKSKQIKKSDYPGKMFHNSRQYFQDQQTSKEMFQNTSKYYNEDDGKYVFGDYKEAQAARDEERRIKRQTDTERQIKELEEVQKRIDNIDITLPMYTNQKGRIEGVTIPRVNP